MRKTLQRLFLWITMVFCLVSAITTSAQSNQKEEKVDAINDVLHFVNEGVHGMLIVHRMLENYNQDLNVFVDLESNKVNFYGNEHLPKDIFEDPEDWFYDDSPYELAEKVRITTPKAGYLHSGKVMNIVVRMVNVLGQINQIRFDLEKDFNQKDLTDRVQIGEVYERLEKGVTLYEEWFELQNELMVLISESFQPLIPTVDEVQYPSLYKGMSRLYLTSRRILLALRTKETENFESLLGEQRAAIDAFREMDFESFGSTRLYGEKAKRIRKNILEQSERLFQSSVTFHETADVPQEYKQYGKFYFYYNSEVINSFNRYGNGLVFEMNQLLQFLDMPVLLFTELPHYYKVIYPEKLEKVDYLEASDNKIVTLPKKLKDRTLVVANRFIEVDTMVVELRVYDHMIQDGDIISLNFNGDWIVEDLLLTSKPEKLNIKLNKEGKNFLILHAENVGRRPPNTMAVDYMFNGKKERIILKSDLDSSEIIELIYKPQNP